ncbi:hypothetical protein [Micromonospora sp. NBC_01638]|nr:hypothetical protein OG811_16830 [Micromonospora sp. NBC_01638]
MPADATTERQAYAGAGEHVSPAVRARAGLTAVTAGQIDATSGQG